MNDTSNQVRYTSRVRRGFGWLLDQQLRRHVEQLVANLRRRKEMTASDEADLLAMLAWLEQESEGQEKNTSLSADVIT